MQFIEDYGVRYVSGMSIDEWNEIIDMIKPAKTYDILYFVPNDINTTVYALKMSSILMTFSIPIVLPGVLCINGPTFINAVSNSSIYLSDIIFPSLDKCLSTYLYIAKSDINMIYSGCTAIITPTYHMIPKIEQVFGVISLYKESASKTGFIQDLPEENVATISENYRAMRADDGASLCNLDGNHVVTFYAGMYPLNKADKLSMRIYDIPTDNKFLVSSTIIKKKQDPINLDVFFLRV